MMWTAITTRKTPIIAIDADGKRTWFESQVAASRELGVSAGHIATACRKEYGYKRLKGCSFEYADSEYQKTLKANRVATPKEERIEQLRKRMKGNNYGKGKKPSEKNIAATRKKLGKPICQYDKNGAFVRDFACCEDVVRELGISHSEDVANGKRKTAGGYLWRWKGEDL